METPNSSGERKTNEPINPVIARSIVNYFQMAENFPPESFEPGNPGNPIRFIDQDRNISVQQFNDFMKDLADDKYSALEYKFFESLPSEQSPVAINISEKIKNLQTIRNNPRLKNILDLYHGELNVSLNPGNIESTWNILRIRSGLDRLDINQVKADFDNFLHLFFGNKALDYVKTFVSLRESAHKKYGEKKKPWDTNPLLRSQTKPEEKYFSFKPKSDESKESDSSRETTIALLDPRGYYQILGLDPISTKALPPEEFAQALKLAYRKAVKKTHTDVGGEREAIVRVNLARDFLENPLNRQTYGR